jgi:hypothetical protein
MDTAEASTFVTQWVDAWNAHDLEAVLAHFSEDAVFSSPKAAEFLGGDGVVRGKDALRRYWDEGIRRLPDLHFEVVGIYLGVDVLVINYRNQSDVLVCEVLRFDGPLVVEGHGAYLSQ